MNENKKYIIPILILFIVLVGSIVYKVNFTEKRSENNIKILNLETLSFLSHKRIITFENEVSNYVKEIGYKNVTLILVLSKIDNEKSIHKFYIQLNDEKNTIIKVIYNSSDKKFSFVNDTSIKNPQKYNGRRYDFKEEKQDTAPKDYENNPSEQGTDNPIVFYDENQIRSLVKDYDVFNLQLRLFLIEKEELRRLLLVKDNSIINEDKSTQFILKFGSERPDKKNIKVIYNMTTAEYIFSLE